MAGMLLTFIWRVQDLFPAFGRLKPTTIISGAAVFVFLAGGHFARLRDRHRHPILRLGLFLLLLMFLSVPGGVYPRFSFNFILEDHVKTTLMMILVFAAVRTWRDVERFALVHLFGAVLYCAVILARSGGFRYYDQNDLGLLIVCTLPLSLYFASPGNPVWRRLFAVAAAGVLLTTFMTLGSRGGFIGLVAVSSFLLVGFGGISGGIRVTAVAGIAGLMLFVGTEQFWMEMSTLLQPGSDYNWSGRADSGRLEIWKRGLGYMVQNPLFGVGASAFHIAEGTLSSLARRQDYGIGLKWSAPHNSFVQIGAELGVFGLAAFVALLVIAFRASRAVGGARLARTPLPGPGPLGQALSAVLVGYVASGFFISHAYSAFLYSTFALIAGLTWVVPVHSGVGSPPARAHRRRTGGRGGRGRGSAPILARGGAPPPAPILAGEEL